MKKNKKHRVPQVGEKFNYFDDGKLRLSRMHCVNMWDGRLGIDGSLKETSY